MKTMRIALVLEFIRYFIPGVYELTLLVPAFFGLYSAARVLGIAVEVEPEVVAGISVTFSCFVWVIFNGLAYGRAERPPEAPQEVQGGRDASSVSHRPQPLQVSQAIEPGSGVQPKEELDSVHIGPPRPGKHSIPAGFP